MRLIPAVLIASTAAFAAVDGTVANLTSGKGQPSAVVTLVELGTGMNTVGSVRTDAAGKFTFPADLKAGTPYLIQALHHGVTYNQMLQPGAQSSGIVIDVYDAAVKVPEAKVTQHMILLEPSPTELLVNEAVIFTNSGKTTYQDSDGTLRIWVPSSVNTPVRLRITAPQGMPISREAEKGKQPNVYVVRYPIKPGETRIDLQYGMPAARNFESRVLHSGGPVRIIAPRGVKLESAALKDLGPEPRTQATVYELNGTEYALNIVGTGTLRDNSAESASAASESPSEQDSPGIDIVKPRVYGRLIPIVSLAFAMFAVGFVLLYRTAA